MHPDDDFILIETVEYFCTTNNKYTTHTHTNIITWIMVIKKVNK